MLLSLPLSSPTPPQFSAGQAGATPRPLSFPQNSGTQVHRRVWDSAKEPGSSLTLETSNRSDVRLLKGIRNGLHSREE